VSSDINKREFTVVGELTEDCRYLEITHYKALKRLVGSLVGEPLEINFKKLRYQRSAAQNRWLWGVAYVTIAAWYKETQGETISKDAIHAHTLQEILGYEIVSEEIMGREVLVVKGKSTSKLTTVEFNDMKDRLQAYWAERGCDIRDPNEHNMLTDHLDDN
jgi:hypothetical protein